MLTRALQTRVDARDPNWNSPVKYKGKMMRLAATLLLGMMMANGAHAVTIERAKLAHPASGYALSIHTIGRTTSPDGKPPFTHQWPGTYWEARFTGAEVTAAFSDPTNILHVYIDGQKVDTETRPGDTQIRFSGLSGGAHTITLEKVTESQNDIGTLLGFNVPNQKDVQPQGIARIRQIEFIGDSYTVGYGNTSTKRECTKEEIWATTDTQQAFGPLTAKHYGADYQTNAFSGRGIVRNYDGFIGDPLPVLYPYALYDGKSEYSDSTWQPQIIMIALRGNDFATPVHAGEKWKTLEDLRADYIASYVAFVKSLRARNPQASFLLTDYGEPEVLANINEVIKRLKADGETRIDLFNAGSNFELTGCDWHLNLADNKRISDTLIAYLDAHPALWQGK